jgi:hypothetical protein
MLDLKLSQNGIFQDLSQNAPQTPTLHHKEDKPLDHQNHVQPVATDFLPVLANCTLFTNPSI